MKYYQFDFILRPDTEDGRAILADEASDAGFESFVETDTGMQGFVQADMLDEELLKNAIADFPLKGVKIEYAKKVAADEDWNATWESHGFEPIVIGGKLLVYDAKNHSGSEYDAPIKIGIEAQNAFGSGTHETTQLMLEAMLSVGMKGKSVLDCGCGTGILGIAAAKLGADRVVGYDIDEWSVRNTTHNAELNGVEVDTHEGDASVLSHISGVFDVVLANINRNILLHDMAEFKEVMSTDSTLILSGFYASDIPQIEAKAAELGLAMANLLSRDSWQCLVFSAAKSCVV